LDAIRLHGIRAFGRHGANHGERDVRQLIEVDLTIELDLQGAQKSDDLAQTLDYAALHRRIVRIVCTTSYALLEALAGALLGAILEDERVALATVTLSKPKILSGATPSVTLTRARVHRNR
jgi:FolB domain-containing protein